MAWLMGKDISGKNALAASPPSGQKGGKVGGLGLVPSSTTPSNTMATKLNPSIHRTNTPDETQVASEPLQDLINSLAKLAETTVHPPARTVSKDGQVAPASLGTKVKDVEDNRVAMPVKTNTAPEPAPQTTDFHTKNAREAGNSGTGNVVHLRDALDKMTVGCRPTLLYDNIDMADKEFRPSGLFMKNDSLQNFIGKWSRSVPTSRVCSGVYDANIRHWCHPINTADSTLMDTITQPHTLPDTSPEPGSEQERHLKVWNSNWLIERERFLRQELLDADRRRATEERNRKDFVVKNESEPKNWAQGKETKRLEDPVHTNRLPNFLRCANAGDMPGVAHIYNEEVREGIQAHDADPVPASTFHNLLQGCTETHKPFIVVIKNTVMAYNLSEWPNKSIFYEYQRMVKSRGKEDEDNMVIGFAFLGRFGHGLGGDAGNSKPSAEVFIYVHPEYRNNRLGSALLDRMLAMTAKNYTSKGGYAWKFGETGGIPTGLRSPSVGKHHRLFISVFASSKDHGDVKWKRKMIERVGFVETAKFSQGFYTRREQKEELLDKITWAFSCN